MIESRQLAMPAYLVAFAIILLPLADVTTSLYPWRIFQAGWRFGAVGLISNALLLPMVGLLIAYVTATVLQQTLARRILGGIALLAGTICALAIIMFALDALQTRASVPTQARSSFTVASTAAAIKTLIASITFLAIGISAFRQRKTKVSDARTAEGPVVVVPPVPPISARGQGTP